MITHTLQLGYLNYDEVNKAKEIGVYPRTQRLGRVREHDRTPSKKVDRTNNASNVKFDGTIILSDIPKDLIFRNSQNAKRYVSNLVLRGLQDDGRIFTGSLCVDDIPREDIMTDTNTGKKFINVRFAKTEYLDQYMNTHELVIARPDSEDVISIGLFKEWRKEGYVPTNETPHPIQQSENERNIPDTLNGIRF